MVKLEDIFGSKTQFEVRLIRPSYIDHHVNNKIFIRVPPATIDKKDRYKDDNINLDVYFRPMDYRWFMVDMDNTTSQRLQIAKDLNAKIIIRTSMNCYQAWFYAPDIEDEEDQVVFAKAFTEKLDGDMNSATKRRIGRLPGYKNKKQGRSNFKVSVYYYQSVGFRKSNKQNYSYLTPNQFQYYMRRYDKTQFRSPAPSRQSSQSDKTSGEGDTEQCKKDDFRMLMFILENEPDGTILKDDLYNILARHTHCENVTQYYLTNTVDAVWNNYYN